MNNTSSVCIIAEAGVNHNGDLGTAFKLVDVAAAAGVDYVKFQTFKTEQLVTRSAVTAEYQKRNTGDTSQSQFDMLKKLELSVEAHFKLVDYAKSCGIKFFSTGFDLESLTFLDTLKLGLWKIPSGEITNLPYLQYIGRKNAPVILSTGMATKEEIGQAIHALCDVGLTKDKLTVLHCNTDYPTPMGDVNLRAMPKFKEDFGVAYGYSDHTLGIEVPIAATALGATVIEKHFTLDRNLPGPDHKASLEPHELKEMVTAIRNISLALGKSEKIVNPAEIRNRMVARKSLVAKRDISKGEKFSEDNLAVRRPGDGLSPMLWFDVIGKEALKDFSENEKIQL